VVGELERQEVVRSPRRRRLSLAAALSYTTADLAITNAGEPLDRQPGLQGLLRQVRPCACACSLSRISA
jgi:hypothetical protein